MELRLGARTFDSGDFAIMTEGFALGADIVEVPADPALVARLRAAEPEMLIATAPAIPEDGLEVVEAGVDLLLGDQHAALAAATGTALACTRPDLADWVRPDGILVMAAAAEVERLARSGLAVLVAPDRPTDPEGLAVTAACAWHGARVFRTDDPGTTREVLEMVASISGTRPPAVARRGLA